MKKFIGREKELESLQWLSGKKVASLVVIKGRRRIGKSRLIEEFCKDQIHYNFMGLAPTVETTLKSQLEEFSRQLAREFKQPHLTFSDWSDAFWYLSEQIKNKKIVLALDETSWMGSKDPDFMGKLKTAWDLYFKKNNKLIIILCGPISVWIEENILKNTAFVGRISQTITLNELPLPVCNEFWGKSKNRVSAYEKLKILAITGGVPRYLEEVRPELSAEENMRQLCFSPEGFLFNEFDRIFEDVLMSRSPLYKALIGSLVDRPYEPTQLCESVGATVNKDTSRYLDEMRQAGFIARDFNWHMRDGGLSKISQYRLKDNYLRFYLKYIEPNKHRIEQGGFEALSNLSLWSTVLGYQFENLVLNNRQKIWQYLKISPGDIVCDNPYLQRKTARKKGCQIDYLIQTKYNTLYLIEIKFSKYELKMNVVEEVNEKIERLDIPKNFSVRTVLIHVNGVAETIEEGDYFSAIMNFGDLLG